MPKNINGLMMTRSYFDDKAVEVISDKLVQMFDDEEVCLHT